MVILRHFYNNKKTTETLLKNTVKSRASRVPFFSLNKLKLETDAPVSHVAALVVPRLWYFALSALEQQVSPASA